VETGCRGGQGSPRAVAPKKKKKKICAVSRLVPNHDDTIYSYTQSSVRVQLLHCAGTSIFVS
jgi:hypothetical protein